MSEHPPPPTSPPEEGADRAAAAQGAAAEAGPTDAPATDAPAIDAPAVDAPPVDNPAVDAPPAAAPTDAAAAAAPETLPQAAPAPTPRRLPRGAKIGLAIAAALVVLLGVAYGLRHVIVLRVARDRARALGIELTKARATGFSLDEASLVEVEFALVDVPGVRGRADALTASQRSPGATRVVASGVAVAIAGDPQTSLEALGGWCRAHPAFFGGDVHASDVVIEVRGAAAQAPWLSARRAKLTTSQAGIAIDAEQSSLLGVASGPMKGTWARDGSRASMQVGAPRGGVAPVRVEVKLQKATTDVEAILAKTSLADLAPKLKADRATVSARAALTLRRGGAFDGVVNATIDGWIPPHDKDMDGILYGTSTRFSSALRVPTEGTKIFFDDVNVEVGGLKLKGNGSADRTAGPKLTLDLKGTVPCSQAARSAAANYGPLGSLVADLAGGHVGGVVAVAVHVEGDVKDPKTFRPRPSISQGCTLR